MEFQPEQEAVAADVSTEDSATLHATMANHRARRTTLGTDDLSVMEELYRGDLISDTPN